MDGRYFWEKQKAVPGRSSTLAEEEEELAKSSWRPARRSSSSIGRCLRLDGLFIL